MAIINTDFDSLINTLDNHDSYYLNDKETLLITKIHKNKKFKDWLNSKGIKLEYKAYHSSGNKQYNGVVAKSGENLAEHFITIAVMKNSGPTKMIKLTCCNTNIHDIDQTHFAKLNSAGFALNGSFFFIDHHVRLNMYDIKTDIDGNEMNDDRAVSKFANKPIGVFRHFYDNSGIPIKIDEDPRKSTFKPLEDPINDGTKFKHSLKFAEDIMGVLVINSNNYCQIFKINDFFKEKINPNSQYLTGNILIQNKNIIFDESFLSIVYNLNQLTNDKGEILPQFTKCVLCNSMGFLLNINQIQILAPNEVLYIGKHSDIKLTTDGTKYINLSNIYLTTLSEDEVFMPYHTKIITLGGPDFAYKIPPAMPIHGSDLNPRTCAFIDENNNVFFMNVEGRQYKYGGVGLDLFQLAELCKAMGAVSMINLDGGGSASLSWKEAGNHNCITTDYDVVEYPGSSYVIKRDTYNVSNFIVVSETP